MLEEPSGSMEAGSPGDGGVIRKVKTHNGIIRKEILLTFEKRKFQGYENPSPQCRGNRVPGI